MFNINMILYDRFEYEDTLQNKGNRLVLGVFDHESQKNIAVKFHLQLWEKFGKRTEESIIEEIEILKKASRIKWNTRIN